MKHGHPFFGRGKPQSYHHGRLKEALIEAARLLLSERGPGGFTLADAAKLAGVTAAAPYRHFADRGALLTELTRRGFELFGDKLKQAWADGAPDPNAALDRMGRAYLAFAREERGLYGAMFASVQTLNAPDAGAAASSALELLRRATAAVLRHRGTPGADAVALAFEIWSLSHGIAMLTIAGHLDTSFEGADPGVILQRATHGLVEAAVRRGSLVKAGGNDPVGQPFP